ncbi:glycerol dehydrogenase [Ohessyouella blattaphilus]|uniref:Glycerol dehydrogenase n=1 Tax=Ohessyouella blattaphilus TaxID=2949333 RepID=A0ABT1EMK6_9FIRM|nr:glycerol dehydrogenase [Ohessyouella blattaphilus]MCP1111027.1 glycerol dehydrogenase [Ohessyouella blattaphilus]MCR8564421.1 glycerol dehydrogenase [Ohessyouella blattaphilus]
MVGQTTRAFGSPLRYIQGPGEFNCLPEYTKGYGRACVVIDGFLYPELSSRIKEAYQKAGSEVTTVCFEGECCQEEIERINEVIRNEQAGVLVGVGGGKTLDAAKLCSDSLELPVIIVPSSASTDAPVSEIAVLYTKDGEYIGSQKMKSNAALVLVDTEIIVKAPKRLFVAGIGDALATWFEAHACEASDAPNYIGTGYRRCKAGMAIADACLEILFTDGDEAMRALESGTVTEAFENVVEANILLSGLGFLNTGLATAHGIHSGLTALPETHKYLHGEKVAFGLVCQMVLENTPAELMDKVMLLMARIGLPISLQQLGVEATHENIMAIAQKTVEGPLVHHENFPVDLDLVYNAIVMADKLADKYK